MCPYPDTNSFFLAIITDLFHIQPGYRFCYVDVWPWLVTFAIISVPFMSAIFYYGMIFNIIGSTEIYIIFIGLKIISSFYAIWDDGSIPPGKSCCSRS